LAKKSRYIEGKEGETYIGDGVFISYNGTLALRREHGGPDHYVYIHGLSVHRLMERVFGPGKWVKDSG